MKHYIRLKGRAGRLANQLNRPFPTVPKAKAALKDWLAEANRKRKAAGLKALKIGDFKIVRIEPHPYAGSRK